MHVASHFQRRDFHDLLGTLGGKRSALAREQRFPDCDESQTLAGPRSNLRLRGVERSQTLVAHSLNARSFWLHPKGAAAAAICLSALSFNSTVKYSTQYVMLETLNARRRLFFSGH